MCFEWLLCIFSSLMGQAPHGTLVTPDELEQIVETERTKAQIPGISVAVRSRGAILLNKGFGVANLELQVPATEKTVYEIASITKSFTAMAIMMLAKDEKLSLDDAIAKHIPGAPTVWDKATLRHLLTHTSGIKSYTSLPGFMQKMAREETNHERFLKTVAPFELEFRPGDKYAYSNSGYYLLGIVIEKASGKRYKDFVRDRIFGPLKMSSTRVNDWQAIIPNRAAGYSRNLVQGEVFNAPYTSMSWPFSAGAIVSTADDLLKFDLALDEHRLLDAEDLDRMWRPTKLNDGKSSNYGFGWVNRTIAGRRTVGHNGGIPGFGSEFIKVPDDKFTVIALANLDGDHAGRIAAAIVRRLVATGGKSAKIAKSNAKSEATSDAAANDDDTALLRRVVEKIIANKAEPRDFSGDAKAALFPDRIRQAGQSLARLGKLTKFERLERTESNGQINLKFRCEFGEAALVCKCVLDKNRRIAGILFEPE